MRLIWIISSLLAIQAGVIKREICDGLTVNGVCHGQEILHENLDRPILLLVDLKSNVLYFTYLISNYECSAARLNLDTKEFKNIEGITNGYAQAVDRNSLDVYIGSSDGLYKYDAVDDNVTFIGAEGANILRVYYKDVLYYLLLQSRSVYTFENGVSKKFPDLDNTKVNHFIIDNEFIYFTNNTGLYSQKRGTKDAVWFNFPEVNEGDERGLAVDSKGVVHICMQDGVYVLKQDSWTVEKIVHIDGSQGLAFDKNDNIVYSDATQLVRLLPIGPTYAKQNQSTNMPKLG
ncbi:hypothetical protein K1T71_013986 [Dendrolimus kikuchii]|uniref:Uncharacterized protein n=1 Tax=Dendrolimus kikuchii TaxID=765133 RepID=A0ACC1CG85_9NEOP|nr:hypothetical protein K1T71_013986 [Dendrolimus kikuchii]